MLTYEIIVRDNNEVVYQGLLSQMVSRYFKFRGYEIPDTSQATHFLVSEIGELSDEVVNAMPKAWVRNHPENKGKGIQGELSDVLMMTAAVSNSINVDPIQCFLDKTRSKGWNIAEEE